MDENIARKLLGENFQNKIKMFQQSIKIIAKNEKEKNWIRFGSNIFLMLVSRDYFPSACVQCNPAVKAAK